MWIWWAILIVFVSIIAIRVRIKRKGYFWKDIYGNKLSFREFLKRWRTGIEGITGKQQKFTQLMGTWITIIGITAGMLVNVIIRMKNLWWWVEIILGGSLIIAITNLIGTYQAYRRFKIIEEEMEKIEGKKKPKKKKRPRIKISRSFKKKRKKSRRKKD